MCGGKDLNHGEPPLGRPKPKTVEVLFTSPLRGLALGSAGDGR